MAFAPTPGGTRGWEEGRRLCGVKPGQGPGPHAALHGARFADGILWVCTELLWFPPSPRTGGLTSCPGPCHPLTSVSVVPMVTAWTCSRSHPDPPAQIPPVPIRSPSPQTPSWGLFCLGELLERGKGACVGARSSSVLGQRPHLQHCRHVPMAGGHREGPCGAQGWCPAGDTATSPRCTPPCVMVPSPLPVGCSSSFGISSIPTSRSLPGVSRERGDSPQSQQAPQGHFGHGTSSAGSTQ